MSRGPKHHPACVKRAAVLLLAGVASLALVEGAFGVAGSALDAPAVKRVVHGDWRIAGFRVRANGRLGGATRALGAPTTKRRISASGCRVVWRRLGVRMLFYNLGGRDPCSRRYGYFSHATIRGAGWRTGRGLVVRDPVRRLRALYLRARYHRSGFFGPGWWLVVRRSRIGTGSSYPGLQARTRDRRVSAFVVRYPAGGD